jgi:hypothetical protein
LRESLDRDVRREAERLQISVADMSLPASLVNEIAQSEEMKAMVGIWMVCVLG